MLATWPQCLVWNCLKYGGNVNRWMNFGSKYNLGNVTFEGQLPLLFTNRHVCSCNSVTVLFSYGVMIFVLVIGENRYYSCFKAVSKTCYFLCFYLIID